MEMKTAKLLIGIGASVLAFVLLGAIVIASMFVGVNNQCISLEKGIQKQYGDNQNSYDNYFKKVLEAAQVTDKYAADFKSIYEKVMQGRYGAGGSKAAFQWLQEHNPQLDASVYRQIQQIIESGRNDFQANQSSLLERKQIYETYIATFPNVIVSKMLGFPKIDLAKYDIVTSDETQKAFQDKKAAPLKVFN